MSAVQKILGMTYTFYENDDKTGKLIGSTITYTPPQDTYYVAASNGYCEGEVSPINIKVPCPPSVSDEAGVEYKVTWLAGLCWTENLRTKKYPGTDDDVPFAKPYTCASCPEKLDTTYGLLYTWHSAVGSTGPNVQGICPDGWRIPTQAEWNLLNNYSAQQIKSTDLKTYTDSQDGGQAMPQPKLLRVPSHYTITATLYNKMKRNKATD